MQAVLSLALLLFAVLVLKHRSQARRGLPPGPSALPVLGSVHKLTLEFQHKRFLEWSKDFGDVIYFKLFRTPAIVLNSLESARELLDRRSAKYSDRTRAVLLAELMGHDSALPFLRYGERFRRHRRWMHDAIGSRASIQTYRPIQVREVHLLLRSLLKNPEAFMEHLYRYVAGTLLEITYGQRLTSMDDLIVQLAERTVNATNESGSPASMLVDFFPILKHLPTCLPIASFKRHALKARADLKAWRETGVNMVRSAMASGASSSCVISALLEAHQGHLGDEELGEIGAIGVDIYGAGTETTYGSLASFVLAMVRSPDVLRKAQKELDEVVGPTRLPDFADRESLPYLNAVVEEVYRWNPGLPLAIPHRAMTDDQYRGYDIPEGCMIMPNIWAMSRDERYYRESEDFRPERHLNETGDAIAQERELPHSYVFGFGRRVCPGQAFADATLWLAIASLIATLDIRKVVDPSGAEITPPASFKPGFTSQPQPFPCKIVPRTEMIAAVISQLDV
ncbi:cytochrome P450 [Dichomitus squalens]|uniref:Cytochrome P450 n=1 Tax=Dichomitus squalens TaxID=114155 RepID=A0A4Q9MPR1_9APHY|nr:cytochrome P450 [Dichomitus squalens]